MCIDREVRRSKVKVTAGLSSVLLARVCMLIQLLRFSSFCLIQTFHTVVLPQLDLLEQEIVSGSGISWAICKSAP